MLWRILDNFAPVMRENEYFSHLYAIAQALNKEFSLHSALKTALEKTVQLLQLDTGWIWLMQGDKSVYLAASYNLPPALKDHPERLSGRCYCIEKYLSNTIEKARNISEIACSRLHAIKSGTLDLKFHATIPINLGNEKVGLINLVSKQKQELSPIQLCILNTIGELVGIVIQRTRAQDIQASIPMQNGASVMEVLGRAFPPKFDALISSLEQAQSGLALASTPNALEQINYALNQAAQLKHQLTHLLDEATEHRSANNSDKSFHYPASPLTDRELEILVLVKKGCTNKQIAEALFISERTVKFHLTSVLSKLSASTRTEAVNIALKRGLISF